MPHLLRFGPFEFNPRSASLRKFGTRIALQPQPAQILKALLETPGEVVSRQDLRAAIWAGNVFLDYEHSLNRSVNKLRSALGDSADQPRYVETIAGVGYRFVANVFVEDERQDEPECPIPNLPLTGTPAVSGEPIAPPTFAGTRPWVSFRVGTAVLLAVVLIVATLTWRLAVSRRAPSRIAVLPTLNYSGDPRNESMADGLTEELTEAVSRLAGGRAAVIARTSAAKYKHAVNSVGEIGHQLAADYVLECSVRKIDTRYRITAQLIRTSDEVHVWSSSFDREGTNPIDVQAEVAAIVAEQVVRKVAAVPEVSDQVSAIEQDLNYRKAIYLLNKRTPATVKNSNALFKESVRVNPNSAMAYAGLAHSYLFLGGGILPSMEAYQKAREAAARALTIDSRCADAYAAMGYIKFVSDLDWVGAEQNYRRAIELESNNALAHHWYAIYLAAFRRFPEALREIENAVRLDPASIAAGYNKGMILIQAGRYADAVQHLKAVQELEPGSPVTPGYLGVAYERLGQLQEAEAAYGEAQRLSGSELPYAIGIAHIQALRGNKSLANRLLRKMEQDKSRNTCGVVLLYAAIGDDRNTISWLERALNDRSCTVTEYNSQVFDHLRSKPEFQALAKRLNLAE
jgi:TolB-like protein/DNA-binding winged helix-turn-helix (wHTH) protein/Flp pilus assembly protein TadD